MTVHHNKYTLLDWDSKLFGYTVAKIQDPLTESDISDSISILKEKRVKLVYVMSNRDDQKIHDLIVLNGGVLVDTKIVYKKTLDTQFISHNDNAHISSYTDRRTDPKLLSLAFQSGVYSRFFTDAGFKNNEFQKLYTQWIEKAIRRSTAFDLLVYRDEKNIITGFITLEKDGNIGTIGLLGVDSTLRRKCIGTALMQSAYRVFLAHHITCLQIATQKNNIPACNFYEKQGFDILSQQQIYHIWL